MKDFSTVRRYRQRLVILLALVSATLSARIHAGPPEPVPDGFVREDMKVIRASILRPASWLCRCTLPAHPFYNFSPQPFEMPLGVTKGLAIHVMVRTGESADERVVKWIAEETAKQKVFWGRTRKNTPEGPFTTYSLAWIVQDEETDGVKMTCEVVFVANRVTNTVYQCWLVAPTEQWKDVERVGETMLASLRPDADF